MRKKRQYVKTSNITLKNPCFIGSTGSGDGYGHDYGHGYGNGYTFKDPAQINLLL